MPDFKVPKDTIEGPPIIEAGRVVLRLDGFKPQLSKGKDSINFNPVFKVVSPSEHADQRVFFNMNSNFRPGIVDFAHAFGTELVKNNDGDYVIPGRFDGPDEDMTKWVYAGPLLGQACDVDLIIEPRRDDKGQPIEGKVQNSIKRFYCTIEGCSEKHALDLTGRK